MKKSRTRFCSCARTRRATFTARRSRSTAECSWCSEAQASGFGRTHRVYELNFYALDLARIPVHRKKCVQAEYAAKGRRREVLLESRGAVDRHGSRTQRVSALAVERKGQFRGGARVVECVDLQIETRRRAQRSGGIKADGRARNRQRGMFGELAQCRRKNNFAGRGARLEINAVLGTKSRDGVTLIHRERCNLIAGWNKQNSRIGGAWLGRAKFHLHLTVPRLPGSGIEADREADLLSAR